MSDVSSGMLRALWDRQNGRLQRLAPWLTGLGVVLAALHVPLSRVLDGLSPAVTSLLALLVLAGPAVALVNVLLTLLARRWALLGVSVATVLFYFLLYTVLIPIEPATLELPDGGSRPLSAAATRIPPPA